MEREKLKTEIEQLINEKFLPLDSERSRTGKGAFCKEINHSRGGLGEKINTIINSITRVDKFLKPLGKKVGFVDID